MVRFILPSLMDSEIISLIPAHRERVSQLISEGKILAYAVAKDRSQGWITVAGTSEKELKSVLASLPLAPHVQFEWHKLMVFDARNLRFPELTLN